MKKGRMKEKKGGKKEERWGREVGRKDEDSLQKILVSYVVSANKAHSDGQVQEHSFMTIRIFLLGEKLVLEYNACMLSWSVMLGSLQPSGTVARQASLSMGFSRQEYWSELSFPPPGDLPDPGTETSSPTSPAFAAGFFTTELPANRNMHIVLGESLEPSVG